MLALLWKRWFWSWTLPQLVANSGRTRIFKACFALVLTGLLTAPCQSEEPARQQAALLDFFEKRVRPLLADNCYTCHSANTKTMGELRVDDRNGLLHGGGRGPAIMVGDPEKSLLIEAVSHTHKVLKMPPNKQLSSEQIEDLKQWIAMGAVWPQEALPDDSSNRHVDYDKLRGEHWAWRPLDSPVPPQSEDDPWSLSDIDRFVWARLREHRLTPAADADKVTLIRRVTFDLTGLPPTPAEIDAFVADDASDAIDKVVDRLLASSGFGERWGRHWLDVARYGESTGSSRNVPYPHAWRYRDYVIAALNADKPFDKFIYEQVAGDLLPDQSPADRDQNLIATGFLALGVKDVNQRFKVRFIMDNVDEQIDTVSRSFLALTVSCARCHDHKFDPVPTADYYALAGIFASTDICAGVRNKMGGGGLDYYDTDKLIQLGELGHANTVCAEEIEKLKKEFDEARAAFEALKGPEGDVKEANGRPRRFMARQRMNKLRDQLFNATDPAANGVPLAIGVREGKQIADTEIRIRGEAEKLGPVAPRGFLSVVAFPDQPHVGQAQSGRLELAQWLTHPANPLTPRVMANRIWQRLFGEGIVRSVDNFGSMGDVPSNPELLDYLASHFRADGWSVKRLIRTIVLSHAYSLSAEANSNSMNVDPANRFIWRHSPRWLDAEELRDAALAAAGQLDSKPTEASAAKDLKVVEMRNNGPEARRITETAQASRHRSIYLPLLRGLTPTSLELFDFAEQGMVTGRREQTTVAPQALYLLNDPFVRRQSLELAQHVLHVEVSNDADRLQLAYRLTLGRTATPSEIDRRKITLRATNALR